MRISACLAWTAACVIPMLAIAAGSDRVARLRRVAMLMNRWARGVVRTMGIRVTMQGPLPPEGALIAPNHVSYADIPSIVAAVPTHFLAKREIAEWFFIGWLLRRTEHPLTSRLAGRDLAETVRSISERLRAGRRVCIFLEGTTTAGDRVLDFMPALVQPAIDAGAPVVPVAISWHVADPRASVRDDVAYWRDDVFGPHAWRFHGVRGIEVKITFCAPIPSAGRTRRELAAEARAVIVRTLGVENAPSVPEWETRPSALNRPAAAGGGTGIPA